MSGDDQHPADKSTHRRGSGQGAKLARTRRGQTAADASVIISSWEFQRMGPESRADRRKPGFGQEAPAWDDLLTPAESNFTRHVFCEPLQRWCRDVLRRCWWESCRDATTPAVLRPRALSRAHATTDLCWLRVRGPVNFSYFLLCSSTYEQARLEK